MAFTIPSEKIYDMQNQKIKENFIDNIDVTSKDEQFRVVNDVLKIDDTKYLYLKDNNYYKEPPTDTGFWMATTQSNFKGGVMSDNTSGNFNYVFGTNSLYTSTLTIPFYCTYTIISKQTRVYYIKLAIPKKQGESIIQDIDETDIQYTLQGTITRGKCKDTDVRVMFTYGAIGTYPFKTAYSAVINSSAITTSTGDIEDSINKFWTNPDDLIKDRFPLRRTPTEDIASVYDTYSFSPQIDFTEIYDRSTSEYIQINDINEGQSTEKVSVTNKITGSNLISKNLQVQANYTWEEADPHSTINNRLPNNMYAQKIELVKGNGTEDGLEKYVEYYVITFALEVSYGVEILPFKFGTSNLRTISTPDGYASESTAGNIKYLEGEIKKTETSYLYKWECDTVDITVNGKVIKLNLSDKTATFGDGTQYPFSVTSNDFLKTSTTINGKDFINEQYSSLQTQYANGKETAVIRCAVGGYTDGKNDKVLFDLYDEVVPMKYTNTGDKPMSLDSKGNAKVFKVLGTELKYDGGLYQILHLQEK